MVVSMNIFEIIKLHKHAINNRESISKSKKCGCFYCKKTFNPQDIVEWTDEETTAICPICGVDSVICDLENYKMTSEDLDLLNKYYFKQREENNVN